VCVESVSKEGEQWASSFPLPQPTNGTPLCLFPSSPFVFFNPCGHGIVSYLIARHFHPPIATHVTLMPSSPQLVHLDQYDTYTPSLARSSLYYYCSSILSKLVWATLSLPLNRVTSVFYESITNVLTVVYIRLQHSVYNHISISHVSLLSPSQYHNFRLNHFRQ
jgi:hypothetical protein